MNFDLDFLCPATFGEVLDHILTLGVYTNEKKSNFIFAESRRKKLYRKIAFRISSRCDTGLVHDLQLTWASGESESESRRAKRVWEQPYDMNVRDNWIIIGVREQPYVIQVCSDR